MAGSPPDERLVYLALKNVFKGEDARLRKSKKIEKLIRGHQKELNVKQLVQEYNIDKVCNVVKALLKSKIFESTLKAKVRFPEVFQVSPAQSAEREASEAEAAKIEEVAIKDVADSQQGGSHPKEEAEQAMVSIAQVSSDEKSTKRAKKSPVLPVASVPSLYPVYLPFSAQHKLLLKVQAILEQACYAFAQARAPEILAKKGWDCAEAVELNQWTSVFQSHQALFAEDELSQLAGSFASVTQIRHTAVHRLRVSAKRIQQFMADAERLANVLGSSEAEAPTIARLRRETDATVEELKRNKDLLESRLADSLKKIAAKRAELDQLERTAMEDMLKEDKEYQQMAGNNLEDSIAASETVVQPSPAASENNTGSESDADCFDAQELSQVLGSSLDLED